MIIGGRDYGQKSRILRIWENFPASQPGSITQIPLGKIPCEAENGNEYGVLAFILVVRNMTWLTAAGKVVDGVSLSQLLANLTIRMANNSPPSAFAGGDYIINGVDGYRALQALNFLSGQPSIVVDGGERYDLPVTPVANQSPQAVNLAISEVNNRGWLQYNGPYAAADTGGAGRTWTDFIFFHFWVGVQRDEQWGRQAIPARWFNGEKPGCAQQGVGYLEFTLGSSVDGATVTWPGSIQVDLYAKCNTYSPSKRPLPLTPRIVKYQATSSNFDSYLGIRKYLSFYKPLTAGGAMQSENYTRVQVKNRGVELVESQFNLNMADIASNEYDSANRRFDLTYSQDALLNRGAARFSRAGAPLLVHHGRNTDSYGDPFVPTRVNIITTGETAFDVLDVCLNPRTADVETLAREWVSDPQAKIASGTDNGNSQESFAPSGKQAVVPGIIESAPDAVPMISNPNAYKAG